MCIHIHIYVNRERPMYRAQIGSYIGPIWKEHMSPRRQSARPFETTCYSAWNEEVHLAERSSYTEPYYIVNYPNVTTPIRPGPTR